MGIQINISEAKAKLSELVRRAEAGEEVYLMRAGTIVAVLRPFIGRAGGMRIGLLDHIGLEAPDAFLESAELEDLEIGRDPADGSFSPGG